jgi:hypothetical protein
MCFEVDGYLNTKIKQDHLRIMFDMSTFILSYTRLMVSATVVIQLV